MTNPRTPTERTRRPGGIPVFALALGGLLSAHNPDAFVYTVGRSGTSNNCSFPTIQAALDAAAATSEADEIWITRDVAEGFYRQQALVANRVVNPDVSDPGPLKIVGGFDDCWDVTPSDVTELDGNGGAKAPVLTILGHDVSIEGIRLTRGDSTLNADSYGGGIAYLGAGSLNIFRSVIDNNDAGVGGGIAVFARGGDARLSVQNSHIDDNRAGAVGGAVLLQSDTGIASLTVGGGTRINRNFAGEGGGAIAMSGRSTLWMADELGGIQVDANGTLGDGGAILAVPPVSILLKTIPVAGSGATFTGNEAEFGGVIALGDHPRLGNAHGDASVRILSWFEHPQVFAFNRAHARGGVISVSNPAGAASVDVCSWNAGFEFNDAQDAGSVAFVRGANTTFRNEATCDNVPAACPGAQCNRILGNASTFDDGRPANGSLFESEDGARIQLQGMRMLHNGVRDLFRLQRRPGTSMSSIGGTDLLVAQNAAKSVAQQCFLDCEIALRNVTIADNALSGAIVGNDSGTSSLSDAIIDQPGAALFSVGAPPPGAIVLTRVLHDTSYPGSGPTLWRGQPTFLDAASGDYRLASHSLGVDWSPPDGPMGQDAYGRERDVDLPWRADLFGTRDLGALETQLGDVEAPLFVDGFDPR
ncbi:MAG: hypothetical protein ACTHK2_01435 [Dokdonella sp.]|uniref:hypothetical protein n=1 Tax=Dokdonella sp. TaxID=2291710 RepID=UPI003F7E773B